MALFVCKKVLAGVSRYCAAFIRCLEVTAYLCGHDQPAGQEPVVLKSTSAGAALNGSSAPVLNGSASRTNGLQASEPKANSSARTLRVGIVLSGGQAPGRPSPCLQCFNHGSEVFQGYMSHHIAMSMCSSCGHCREYCIELSSERLLTGCQGTICPCITALSGMTDMGQIS